MKRFLPGALALASLLAACGGGDGGNAPPDAGGPEQGDGGRVTLTGAGATFPAPIYGRWFSDYGKAHPVQVNYQSIGSGGGIQQVTAGTVDFGASDAPMTVEEAEGSVARAEPQRAGWTVHPPISVRRCPYQAAIRLSKLLDQVVW